jgi:hypothetical protein
MTRIIETKIRVDKPNEPLQPKKALSNRQGLEVAEMVNIQASYLEVWHACGVGCLGGLLGLPLFFLSSRP